MHLSDIPKALADILEVFDGLGVEYRIGGSVASSTLGHFRATNDVDIVADLRLEQSTAFIQSLRGRFYLDDAYIAESIRSGRSFNLIHLTTFIKVDVFPLKKRSFDQAAFSRKLRVALMEEPNLQADLFTPEDVLIQKLERYVMGGRSSERQWGDILGILRVQDALDLDYLRRWAKELGLLELLEQAHAQAPLD